MTENKKGKVTITYLGPGNVVIDPPMGQLDRNHQKMTWNLVNQSGGKCEFKVPGGITFPWPLDPPPTPPPTYSQWPGDVPTGNANQYTADAKLKVPHGSPNQFYLYWIDLETDTGPEPVRKVRRRDTDEIIDPPIENQPEP